MADLTASVGVLNSGVALTLNDAAASQTIDLDDKADEKVVLVAQNTNTGDGQTATITIAPGDFLGNVLGTLSVDVAIGTSKIIGPLEGTRFKNSASKMTVGCAVTASGTVSEVLLGVIEMP